MKHTGSSIFGGFCVWSAVTPTFAGFFHVGSHRPELVGRGEVEIQRGRSRTFS